MTFSEIVKDHGHDIIQLQERKDAATSYRHFGTGFVLVNTSITNEDYVTSFAVDDKYPLAMWRHIRSLLINRKRPIVVQLVRNYDRLIIFFRKYGAVELDDGIIVFPITYNKE